MKNIVLRNMGAFIVGFVLVSCGGMVQYHSQGTERVPGADFTVGLDRQGDENWLLSMEASNLPPPTRLDDQMTLYSVWIVPEGLSPQRIGNMTYNDGDRAATMSATTVQKNFQVVVSAEVNADAGAPSDLVVFRYLIETP